MKKKNIVKAIIYCCFVLVGICLIVLGCFEEQFGKPATTIFLSLGCSILSASLMSISLDFGSYLRNNSYISKKKRALILDLVNCFKDSIIAAAYPNELDESKLPNDTYISVFNKIDKSLEVNDRCFDNLFIGYYLLRCYYNKDELFTDLEKSYILNAIQSLSGLDTSNAKDFYKRFLDAIEHLHMFPLFKKEIYEEKGISYKSSNKSSVIAIKQYEEDGKTLKRISDYYVSEHKNKIRDLLSSIDENGDCIVFIQKESEEDKQ